MTNFFKNLYSNRPRPNIEHDRKTEKKNISMENIVSSSKNYVEHITGKNTARHYENSKKETIEKTVFSLCSNLSEENFNEFLKTFQKCPISFRSQAINTLCPKSKTTPLHLILASGKRELFEIIKNNELDFKSRDSSGNLPAHIVLAQTNDIGYLEYLDRKTLSSRGVGLFSKYSLHQKNDEGLTAPAYAAKAAKPLSVWFAVKKIKDVKHEDLDATTLLREAIIAQDPRTLEHVLPRNSRVNLRDTTGETPLELAARLGNAHIFRAVYAYDPHGPLTPNEKGQNVAHIAVLHKSYGVVATLPEGHQCFTVRDHEGRTPQDIALQTKDDLLIQITEAKTKSPYD